MKKEKSFCTVMLILLLCIGSSIFIITPRTFSEHENRSLATLPKLTPESIWNKTFFEDISSFYRDQFVFRQALLSTRSLTEALLLRGENGSVIFGDEGYLIARHDYESLDILSENVSAISKFSDKMKDLGKDVKISIAPRAVDVLSEGLPASYPTEYDKRIYGTIDRLDTLDGRAVFDECCLSDNVWYKTDHHWTTKGAYLFYRSMCEQYGIEPYGLELFTIESVSEDFLGTSYSKSQAIHATADTIELYRYENDRNFTVYLPSTSKSISGFYDFSALQKKDKYQIFLSGNSDVVQIRENGAEQKPRLLLIKDSFANSSVPFLALHFDIDLIDLRYYKGSLSEYIEKNGFDRIGILCGADTLATDRSMIFINS